MSTLTRQDIALIQMLISQAITQNPPPIARDGIIIGGSHSPKDATVSAMFGDTYAIMGDDGDQYVPLPKIPVATTQIGDQYAPVGNERAVLIPTQGGPVALFIHDEDDSPGAPAGERWITHRNSSGVVDSFLKHTNDGPTPGDAKGGVVHQGGALHKTGTAGGHSVTQDDSAKKVTVQSAGGHTVTFDDTAKTVTVQSTSGHQVVLNDQAQQVLVKTKNGLQHLLDDTTQKITHQAGSVKTIVDGAGNTISHVATQVGLGDLPGNLPASAAAITNAHLSTFESSLLTKRLDDLSKLCAAMVSAGVPNAGAVYALIASLVHVPVPSGSSTVFIK